MINEFGDFLDFQGRKDDYCFFFLVLEGDGLITVPILKRFNDFVKVHKTLRILFEANRNKNLVLFLNNFKRFLDFLELGLKVEPNKLLVVHLNGPICIN